MIKVCDGDMFDYDSDIMINTVNCVGVMGKGVSLRFKKQYPKMFRYYKTQCTNNHITPGSLSFYRLEDDRLIINFATKDHWRNCSRYYWIDQGLDSLRSFLSKATNNPTVVIPAVGCGCGGLDWNVVFDMINKHLSDLDNVVIYVFPPRQ